MTIHHLHLHPEPFRLVQSGRKTIESRLFDEKRRLYQAGDRLVFINRANEQERIEATIVQLHHADSFQDLFSQDDLRGKFGTDSIDELLRGVGRYYSVEDQEMYGVLGIEFI